MGGYRQIKCIDRAGFNVEAFRMVIPDDWTCYGGVTWVNDIHMPVYSNFAVVSPDGTMALEGFPIHKYMWSQDPFARLNFKYWETASTKVHPPVPAEQALVETILGTYRTKMQDLKVVAAVTLSPSDPMVAPDPRYPPQSPMRFGKVRVVYGVGEVAIEEELYGALEVVQAPNGMVISSLNAFGIRARRGELDPTMNLFRMMKTSMQVNPSWIQQVVRTMEGLYQQQTANIQQIGEFSRRWSQMADQVRESSMQRWEESNRAFDRRMQSYSDASAAQDRSAQRFDNYLRGEETVYDPVQGREVQVESGHVAVYTNGLGERLYSDSYNYNPNERLTGNWTRMDPVL
jgi:hypothetical protein